MLAFGLIVVIVGVVVFCWFVLLLRIVVCCCGGCCGLFLLRCLLFVNCFCGSLRVARFSCLPFVDRYLLLFVCSSLFAICRLVALCVLGVVVLGGGVVGVDGGGVRVCSGCGGCGCCLLFVVCVGCCSLIEVRCLPCVAC